MFGNRNRQIWESSDSRNRRRFRGNQSLSEPSKKGKGVAAKNTGTVGGNQGEISGDTEIPSVSKQQPATPAEGIRSRKIQSTQINEENIDKVLT